MKQDEGSRKHSNNGFAELNNSFCSGRGDLSFSGNLLVTGNFSGKLNVAGCLTIGDSALVSGEIFAADLAVHGFIIGSAKVEHKALFYPESKFSGVLTAREAEFHEGCQIRGMKTVDRVIEKKVAEVLKAESFDTSNSFYYQIENNYKSRLH